MKQIMCLLLAALFSHSGSYGQQTDSLWRGIYLAGETEGIHYDTLRHSLHLNMVEGATGYNRADIPMLTNSAGIKVLNQTNKFFALSLAQRMEYEAELGSSPTLLWNWFDYRHPEKQIITEGDTISLKLSVGAQADTMVCAAVPDSEYHYNQANWLATFRMKAEYTQQAIPTTYVARITVWCKGHVQAIKESILTVSMFPGSGVYRDFVLPFSLVAPHACNKPNGVLTGSPLHAMGNATCGHIDLQVYWYGNHTTYLDKVIVEDTLAHSLFAGVYDTVIRDTAARYAGFSQHGMFYLQDEPFMSTFLSFNYVANQIKIALGQNNPLARSVAVLYTRYARFLTDAQPAKLMVDAYFVTSRVPRSQEE